MSPSTTALSMEHSMPRPDAVVIGVAVAGPLSMGQLMRCSVPHSVRSGALEPMLDAERVDGVDRERGDERMKAVRHRMEWEEAQDTVGSVEGIHSVEGIRRRADGRGRAADGRQSAEDAVEHAVEHALERGVGQRASDRDWGSGHVFR